MRMEKWEYLTETDPSDARMNELGADRWEMVAAWAQLDPYARKGSGETIEVTKWKRPVQTEPEKPPLPVRAWTAEGRDWRLLTRRPVTVADALVTGWTMEQQWDYGAIVLISKPAGPLPERSETGG